MIRGPAAATLQADVTVGHPMGLSGASPSSWMDGGFFCQDDVLSAMDRVHGHPRRCALCSNSAALWYPFPPEIFGEEDQRQYIRSQCTTKEGDPTFTNSFHNQGATSKEEDGAHSTIVHHSHNCALGKHVCTVNLSKQCNTS